MCHIDMRDQKQLRALNAVNLFFETMNTSLGKTLYSINI